METMAGFRHTLCGLISSDFNRALKRLTKSLEQRHCQQLDRTALPPWTEVRWCWMETQTGELGFTSRRSCGGVLVFLTQQVIRSRPSSEAHFYFTARKKPSQVQGPSSSATQIRGGTVVKRSDFWRAMLHGNLCGPGWNEAPRCCLDDARCWKTPERGGVGA